MHFDSFVLPKCVAIFKPDMTVDLQVSKFFRNLWPGKFFPIVFTNGNIKITESTPILKNNSRDQTTYLPIVMNTVQLIISPTPLT